MLQIKITERRFTIESVLALFIFICTSYCPIMLYTYDAFDALYVSLTNNWEKEGWSELGTELFWSLMAALTIISFLNYSYYNGLKRIISPANLLFVYADNKLSVFENGVAVNKFLISEDIILSTRKENQSFLRTLPQKKLLSFHTKNFLQMFLQREIKIGYNRATRVALKLELLGFVRSNDFGILEIFSSRDDFIKHFEKIEHEFSLEMKEDIAYIRETLIGSEADWYEDKDVIFDVLICNPYKMIF